MDRSSFPREVCQDIQLLQSKGVGSPAVCRLGLLCPRINHPPCSARCMRRRAGGVAVQQLSAKGTLLASFRGQPTPYALTGVAVVQTDGGGAPLRVAVADLRNNNIAFFQRTL